MSFRVFMDFKTLSVEYGNSNIIFKCFFVLCFAVKWLAMMSKSRLFFAMRDKFRLFEKVLLCWANGKAFCHTELCVAK